jgi:subfamily B ATP-binding cassette protein MsbA
MSLESEDDPAHRTFRPETISGNIRFDEVSFSYEEGKEVLKKVSFDAPAGSLTALVGSSGSGKSTIAGLAASFLVPQSGTITVDGVDLNKISLESYRSKLGVVLQDDFLFDGTIRENILFARPDATNDELNKAVEAAYVHEFAGRFEKGLDTVIGERGVKLSGGQRQRLTIARAILADPRILVLDEATSSLDTESESLIQESLKSLLKGRTTFVIAHRLSTIRQADQILVIEDGRIAERGTHEELIEKKGRYFELYTYQARI